MGAILTNIELEDKPVPPLFGEYRNPHTTQWAAGFVSYGVNGGIRAVEHLRQVLAEVRVATVRAQVALDLFSDFEITTPTDPGVCTPGEHQTSTLITVLDEVIAWSRALEPLRDTIGQAAVTA